MKIDRTSNIPLYEQVKQSILNAIQDGVYKPGTRIPAEGELCKMLNVSRPTVRQAVAELVAEGVVNIERGRGTYVCDPGDSFLIDPFSAFSFSLLSVDRILDLSVISAGPAEHLPPFLLSAYGIDPDDRDAQKVASGFYRIIWLNGKDGVAYAVTTTYIPAAMFPELPQQIMGGESMLDITANKYAFLPARSLSRMRSATADLNTAMELNCAQNAPIFLLRSVFRSRSDDICEISETKLRSDVIELGFSEDAPTGGRRKP